MIYLFTHIVIGKYYSNFLTQFIIGTVTYIVLYLMSREFVNSETFVENKYYLYSLIIIDLSFLLYRSKLTKKYFKKDDIIEKINLAESETPGLSLSSANNSMTELSISDFKLDHSLSEVANTSECETDIFEKIDNK